MRTIKTFCVILIALQTISTRKVEAQTNPAAPENQMPAYLDTTLSFEVRATNLVSSMTLDEKISQMQNDAAAIPRLGVAKYNWWNECLHGVARNGIATVFPQAIGMAATWDPALILTEADVISTEARAKYNYAISKDQHGIFQGLTFWSPNINIVRDPRWGRGQETYGEDPFLTSTIGVAFVRGLQGDNPKYFKVISTPKHFAVHSGPEPERHRFDARPSLRDLYETYLPAFEACVRQGGAYSVMGAYNSVYGVPCTASKFLLTDILRDKWGFKGYVVSDCGAIWDIVVGHKYAPDLATASALAVKAGCDLTCGSEYFSLKDAVARGIISEGEIDTAVTSLMLGRFKLGMFDPPDAVPYSQISISDNDTEAHRRLARKVADESIVLLKNARETLPLKKNISSVAVVGLYADDIDVLLGNYNGVPSEPVTILQGIKNKLGDNAKVGFAAGYNLLEDTNEVETIDRQFVRPAGGVGGHGLYAEYFDNFDLRGNPVLTRVDSVMEQFWWRGFPGAQVSRRFFSMRWNGILTPPATGMYEMRIATRGKCRLYFGDSLIINRWGASAVKVVPKPAIVYMEKGKEYRIEADYGDSVDYAGIRLQWRRTYEKPKEEKLIADAVSLTQRSDVTIAVVGISPRLEGEESDTDLPGFRGGDRTNLNLPAGEEKLLKALRATTKPIVLVVVGGSALTINWEENNLPAIIDAWYPGEEGGDAVADVLFGDYDPAGRLPVTFYKSVRDIPPFTDYSMAGRTYRYFSRSRITSCDGSASRTSCSGKGKALYPFGFGLSYTSFEYSKLEVSKDTAKVGDTLNVTLNVTNSGKFDGEEVVQLYVRDLTSKRPQPIRSLRGFERLSLKKGQSRNVEILLPVESFKYFDEAKNDYVVEPGKYELQIGSSSSDIKLKTFVSVTD